jgi:hypothetical protein
MVLDLFPDESFRAGLLIGTLGAAVLLLAGTRLQRLRPASVAVLAALIVLARIDVLPGALVAALAVVAAGSLLLVDRDVPKAAWPAVWLEGAVLVAVAVGGGGPGWLDAFTIVLAFAAAGCVGSLGARPSPRGFEPILIVLTVLGVYGAVPETDPVRVVVGALLPAVALGLWRAPFWDRAGASTLAALVVWAAAAGGQTRPAAVIGSAVCFGVLLVDPLVVGALPGTARAVRERGRVTRLGALVVIHAGVVAFGSRVVGLRTSSLQAAVLGAAALLAALVAVAGIELTTRSRERRVR